jgi:hypothetical protein
MAMSGAKLEEKPADSSAAKASSSQVQQSERAHRELVRRIVASPTFARSERLSALFTYVCEMTLKGRESEVNEQKIGHAVFGRSPDYDSSVDGIVRTQASRLRQRLDQYFRQEGIDEPVRIVIPRGGYVPIFEPRPAAAPALPATEPQISHADSPVLPLAAGVPTATPSIWTLLPWVLCAVLAVVVAGFVIRDHARRSMVSSGNIAHPHPLWSRIFSTDRPTLVIPADSGLVIHNNMTARTMGLNEYLQGEYRTPLSSPRIYGTSTTAKDWQANLGSRRYTSVVDLDIILSLEQRARQSQGAMEVRYARDVRPNDLKSGNVVLLGAAEANPWVELFEKKMNFVFHDDYTTNIFSVINRSPRQGEPAQWDSALSDPQHRVYGLVAYVPNLTGDGDALIIEGTSMSGTEGAGDFVLDNSQLLPFLKQIQRPDGTIPHFELVVGTQNISSSAAHSSLLAWRTMN